MKSKVKPIEECTTLFEIEVPKETIDQAFEEAYAQITKVASLPGFRAGKVPRDLVKKHFAKEAKKDVIDRVISDAYQKALEEHKIEPIGFPDITDLVLEEGSPMSFKASVDTRPKFKIKNYKGIQVDKKKVQIKDEDVKKAIDNLREYTAKYVAVEDRPAQWEDYIVTDLERSIEGKPGCEKKDNFWLLLDKESLLSGLTEKIIGMKKGEERDIEVNMPEKYPDKDLAGKKAKYHVKIKEIKLRQLPNIDDDFAKDLGKENLEDLKKEIAAELEKKMKSDSEIATENQLLNKLMDENSFSVPSSLVNKQIRLMTENAKAKLTQKGFSKEDLEKKNEEFTGRFKDDAVRQVRLLFILDRIATSENIDADQKDLDSAYKSISIQSGKGEQEVKSYYEKEGLVDNLLERIREEKTIEFLLKSADVKEKD
ncbi:MAG: trigger factor [Candidatus Omnitrophota bacterium]|nr:trigger factor [Candidatus Omnitrophota bacterium]